MPRSVQSYSRKRPYDVMGAAQTAYRIGKKFGQAYKGYKKSKSMPTRTAYAHTPHQNPINSQAKRASMKRKGRKNVRSIVHGKKPVKVSRTLRKKVQKVIDGGAYKGTYHTTRFGTVGCTTTGNGGIGNLEDVVESMGGYTNQLAYQKRNKDVDGNTRFWFAHALQSADTLASLSERLEQGSEWQFFTPLKILDAASVLWNKKLISRNYGEQAGNLNTVHVQATGVPVVGTVGSPNIKGLKVHVDNCYVKFTLKNNSQRAMTIDVYNCVPKVKFPDTTPLQAFVNAVQVEADGANSAYISAVTVGHTSLQQEDALISNPALQPNMMKSFNATYKYERITIKIAPGETCQHSVQGPKGYTLDYNKLYNGGIEEQEKAFKGTSMFVMMAVTTDLAYAVSGVATATTDQRTGRFFPGFSAKNSIAQPISIQWDEVYRLSIPEIVGFVSQASDIGIAQTLNKKLPRRAFGNFTVSMVDAEADPVYTQFDEEQPGTAINAGRYL